MSEDGNEIQEHHYDSVQECHPCREQHGHLLLPDDDHHQRGMAGRQSVRICAPALHPADGRHRPHHPPPRALSQAFPPAPRHRRDRCT